MTRILLISPKDENLINTGDRPNLGLLYIASMLEKYKHTVKVIDLNHDSFEAVQQFNPEYVGISFMTPLYHSAVRLSKAIRAFTTAKTICGGAHPSADPESCLKDFDYVVVGEGEYAFLKILSEKPPTGTIIRMDNIRNLDTTPKPARHLLKMSKYNMRINGKRTATLISSRGCNGHCVFCSRKALGDKVRMHSPEYVIEEMEEIMNYGYKSFYFQDDCFTYDKERVKKICEMIKEKGWNISLRVTTRSDLVDYDTLSYLKEVGLDIISLGIEHADDDVLKIAGKGMKVKQHEDVIRWCKQLNVRVKGFFILNLPGATEESIDKTIKWIKRMDIDEYDFYTMVAFPGSVLWDNSKKLGMRILDRDYGYAQTDGRLNIDSEDLPQEKVLEILRGLK